jgi:hypothetical protein
LKVQTGLNLNRLILRGILLKGVMGREFTIGPSDVSGSTEISPQVDSEIHDRDIGVDPKYPGFKGIEN